MNAFGTINGKLKNKKLLIFIAAWECLFFFMPSENEVSILYVISGIGMMFLLYHSWEVHKSSVPAAVLMSTGAVLVSCLALCDLNDIIKMMLIFLILLSPVFFTVFFNWLLKNKMNNGIVKAVISCMPFTIAIIALFIYLEASPAEDYPMIAMFVAESLIWSFALNLKDVEKEEHKKILWNSWLICLAMFFVYITDYSLFIFRYMNKQLWNVTLTLSLPIVYPVVFWRITKQVNQDAKSRYTKIAAGYFAFSTLLYLYSIGIADRGYSAIGINWALDTGIYYILISLIVYAVEMKSIRGDKIGGHLFPALLAVIYSVGCLAATFMGNERIRIIFSNIGDPAVKIQNTYRVAWPGYRLEAALVIVAVIVIILLKKKWINFQLNRMKNYLAVSYLIRAAMSVILFLFMFNSDGISFPFIAAEGFGLDLMILYYLFKQNNKETEIDSTEVERL